MSIKRAGPRKTVSYNCGDCKYHKQVKDYHPGDPGWDHYCTYFKKEKYFSCYGDSTPKWCPFLPGAKKLSPRKRIKSCESCGKQMCKGGCRWG